MRQKIKPSEYPLVVERHRLGEKPHEIAPSFNVGEDAIRRILKKCFAYTRSNSRRHFYDESFFNSIDTEEKAYFLGLMYADGNNTRSGMIISLCEPDQYLLERFANALGYTGGLTLPKKRKSFHKQKHVLSAHGLRISSQLGRLGCAPNKSLCLRFPTPDQVPDELMNHFLRGYFDGDGTVRHDKKANKFQVQLTSSGDFCAGLNDFLEGRFGFRGMTHTYSHSKAEDIRLSTRTGLVLLDYLYDNCSIKMIRKYNKMVAFLKEYRPKNVGGAKVSTEHVTTLRDKWLALSKS